MNRLLLCLVLIVVSGCGYTLQASRDTNLEKEGVRRLYVTPLVNNSYKSGVQNLVYNSLLRALSGSESVRLVSRPEEADAILGGTVNVARYDVRSTAAAKDLPPKDAGRRFETVLGNIRVATSYLAILECSFMLNHRHPPSGKPAKLWGASFSQSKPFAGANQLSTPGTTSALINESEFDRALGDLATQMMADVRENMLARF
ncbi:MAG: LPS assembly lipoprotein LptE [Oligoflexia bacterium]|nr:LPS assembly lipoprotein LptE [Oligoflexia bacterium]